MPEVSRFLGITIHMYFDEHNPPHFHVKYGEYNAQIDINSFALLQSYLPAKVLGLVVEWAEINQSKLIENWLSIEKDGYFNKITPLV